MLIDRKKIRRGAGAVKTPLNFVFFASLMGILFLGSCGRDYDRMKMNPEEKEDEQHNNLEDNLDTESGLFSLIATAHATTEEPYHTSSSGLTVDQGERTNGHGVLLRNGQNAELIHASATSTEEPSTSSHAPKDEQNKKQSLPSAIMTTERLHIAPCKETDIQEYHEHIYRSQTVMEKFATGQCRDIEYVTQRVASWADRWQQGVPFSAFTLRKPDDSCFLGTMVLGGADEPNSSEIAYMIKYDEWGKGYGSEAVGELMQYAASLHRKGASLPNGEIFNRVIATCRQDNKRSYRVLQKLGFSVYKTSQKFGHTRDHYEYCMGQE